MATSSCLSAVGVIGNQIGQIFNNNNRGQWSETQVDNADITKETFNNIVEEVQ